MISIARGSISTNADTAVIAAPGNARKIYVYWIVICVNVAGTTSRFRAENGVAGSVLARLNTTTADTMLQVFYNNGLEKNWPGSPLSDNTALNFNTSGGAAATIDYEVAYEIKGGS